MHILSILHTVEAFFPLTEKKINSYGSEKSFFFSPILKLKFFIIISKSGNVKFQDFCQFLIIF